MSFLILLTTLIIILYAFIYFKGAKVSSKIVQSITNTVQTVQVQDFKLEDDEYLVNTMGCNMKRLQVENPKIQEFFTPPDPIVCSPPALTESDDCKNYS